MAQYNSPMIPMPYYNGMKTPTDGARFIPLDFDFTLFSSYDVDFTLVMMQNKMTSLQAFYIDNSVNPSAITIDFGFGGHTIVLQAGQQGYVNVIVNQNPKFNVSSVNGTNAVILALNFAVPNAIWGGEGGSPNPGIDAPFLPSFSGGASITANGSTSTNGDIITPNVNGSLKLTNLSDTGMYVIWGVGTQTATQDPVTNLVVPAYATVYVAANGANNIAAITSGGTGVLQVVPGTGYGTDISGRTNISDAHGNPIILGRTTSDNSVPVTLSSDNNVGNGFKWISSVQAAISVGTPTLFAIPDGTKTVRITQPTATAATPFYYFLAFGDANIVATTSDMPILFSDVCYFDVNGYTHLSVLTNNSLNINFDYGEGLGQDSYRSIVSRIQDSNGGSITLGQSPSNQSLPVVLASNQVTSLIAFNNNTFGTQVLAVNGTSQSVTIPGGLPGQVRFFNAGTAICFVNAYGPTATLSSLPLGGGQSIILSSVSTQVSAISDGANLNLYISPGIGR